MGNTSTTDADTSFPWLSRLKAAALSHVSQEQKVRVRRWMGRTLVPFIRKDAKRLAVVYGSDKLLHGFMGRYAAHFSALRQKKPLTLLEIGIGGYDDPHAGGNSLRMWKAYFPHGRIYGLDIHDKSQHDEKRIRTFQGDQTDEILLRSIIREIGAPDIIIDDGSHINSHVIKTFKILFPLLSDAGIYVVEDLQTAYWPHDGGSSDDLLHADTSMVMLKGLADGLNYEELIRPGYAPTYFDEHIVALHFYHNIAFVCKGTNKDGSSLIQKNVAHPSFSSTLSH